MLPKAGELVSVKYFTAPVGPFGKLDVDGLLRVGALNRGSWRAVTDKGRSNVVRPPTENV